MRSVIQSARLSYGAGLLLWFWLSEEDAADNKDAKSTKDGRGKGITNAVVHWWSFTM